MFKLSASGNRAPYNMGSTQKGTPTGCARPAIRRPSTTRVSWAVQGPRRPSTTRASWAVQRLTSYTRITTIHVNGVPDWPQGRHHPPLFTSMACLLSRRARTTTTLVIIRLCGRKSRIWHGRRRWQPWRKHRHGRRRWRWPPWRQHRRRRRRRKR